MAAGQCCSRRERNPKNAYGTQLRIKYEINKFRLKSSILDVIANRQGFFGKSRSTLANKLVESLYCLLLEVPMCWIN